MLFKKDSSPRRSNIFDRYALEYDNWYNENKNLYLSEVEALKRHQPFGYSLEVGAGTGRFALPLGIHVGVDISLEMLKIAKKRSLKAVAACAERLPFPSSTFDTVLFIFTLCFLKNPRQPIEEAKRVLKPNGTITVGFIDRDSPLGKLYEEKKKSSKFYKEAHFYSTQEIISLLKKHKFRLKLITQTLFTVENKIQPVKEGYGEGGFVVISASKI